jgi:hypothetical protein
MKLPFLLFRTPEQFEKALRQYGRVFHETEPNFTAAIRSFVRHAQVWGFGELPAPPVQDPGPTCRTCKGPILTGQDYTCEHGPHHGNHSDCIAHLVEALSKLKKPEPAE